MAKILVADDNSNVQKTLALALADLGVEIAAVNNGEAAVRKLPDISPDLILADIFMPVRNGYEVCEYAKKDSRFSHIPVILLVGAFDPFDEREAQRVGADGILKKPFVPPEPLITMVRTLLDRTLGERLVAVSVSKPAVVAPVKAAPAAVAEIRTPVQETPEEPSAQELPSPVGHVQFGEGEHPVAFGQLLETPVQEPVAANTAVLDPVDDEQVLTSSRPETLGDPIFWRNDAPPEPEVEPEAPEDVSTIPEMRTWHKDEESLPRREEGVLLQPIEPMELVREELPESPETVVESETIVLDAAAQAPLTVDSGKPADLAANPLEWMATAPPQNSAEPAEAPPECNEPVPGEAKSSETETIESAVHPLDTAAGTEPIPSEIAETEPLDLTPEVTGPVSVPVIAVQDTNVPEEFPAHATQEFATPELTASAGEHVALHVPEVGSNGSSHSTIEPTAPELTASAESHVTPPVTEDAPKVPSQSTIDTARSIPLHDWEDLTARLDLRQKPAVAVETKPESTPAPPAPAPVAHALASPTASVSSLPPLTAPTQQIPPDPALVEAVVQRVLDKMRPQVVDIITKEFLRPIVQALVHREIEKQ